jgi:hypothetical protein
MSQDVAFIKGILGAGNKSDEEGVVVVAARLVRRLLFLMR